MLGCGETPTQVLHTLKDLRNSGVDVVTFGQYLRPSTRHMKVYEYVTPEAFEVSGGFGDLCFLCVAELVQCSSLCISCVQLHHHLQGWQKEADAMGFLYVAAGPLVSYWHEILLLFIAALNYSSFCCRFGLRTKPASSS